MARRGSVWRRTAWLGASRVTAEAMAEALMMVASVVVWQMAAKEARRGGSGRLTANGEAAKAGAEGGPGTATREGPAGIGEDGEALTVGGFGVAELWDCGGVDSGSCGDGGDAGAESGLLAGLMPGWRDGCLGVSWKS